MSLFGSIMNDMERDPIFGAHHRAMNRMMGGFFGGGGGVGGGQGSGGGQGVVGITGGHPMFGGFDSLLTSTQLMPFGVGVPQMGGTGFGLGGGGGGGGGAMGLFGSGFPAMNALMNHHHHHHNHHNNVGNNPQMNDGLFYSSSSVTSITSGGPDGRPHVYQASSSTRQAPGGVKETRKTITDTRSGVKKMELGRHLGERGYIQEREDNLYTGQREENQELINIGEVECLPWKNVLTAGLKGRQLVLSSTGRTGLTAGLKAGKEAPVFDQEWKQAARHGGRYSRESQRHQAAIGYHPAYNRQSQRGISPQSGGGSVTIEELPPSGDEGGDEMGEETTTAMTPPSTVTVQPVTTQPHHPRPRPHRHSRQSSSATSTNRKLKRAKKY